MSDEQPVKKTDPRPTAKEDEMSKGQAVQSTGQTVQPSDAAGQFRRKQVQRLRPAIGQIRTEDRPGRTR